MRGAREEHGRDASRSATACPCSCTKRRPRPTSAGHLAEIRRGGLNGLGASDAGPGWRPDFGPEQPHPTAGATAIGARPILIAYNVNLASNRLGVAKRAASVIRASSGGLAHVKAMGVQLSDGIVQVSMNLTNYRETSMPLCSMRSRARPPPTASACSRVRLWGSCPPTHCPPDPRRRLRLREADLDRILERRLERPPARSVSLLRHRSAQQQKDEDSGGRDVQPDRQEDAVQAAMSIECAGEGEVERCERQRHHGDR